MPLQLKKPVIARDAMSNDNKTLRATEIVSAYVSNNAISIADLPGLIGSVYSTLNNLGVPVEQSAPALGHIPINGIPKVLLL